MSNPTFGGQLMFPTEYTAAEDLGGNDADVTIESVKSESLRTTEGTETKFVIRFEGHKKRLVLNKTNAKLIAAATGVAEARQWVGLRITLYPTTCQAFGETVSCIRVRDKVPQQQRRDDPKEVAAKFRAWLASKGIREIAAVDAINGTPIDSATDADWEVLRKWAATAKPIQPQNQAGLPWESDDAAFEASRATNEGENR